MLPDRSAHNPPPPLPRHTETPPVGRSWPYRTRLTGGAHSGRTPCQPHPASRPSGALDQPPTGHPTTGHAALTARTGGTRHSSASGLIYGSDAAERTAPVLHTRARPSTSPTSRWPRSAGRCGGKAARSSPGRSAASSAETAGASSGWTDRPGRCGPLESRAWSTSWQVEVGSLRYELVRAGRIARACQLRGRGQTPGRIAPYRGSTRQSIDDLPAGAVAAGPGMSSRSCSRSGVATRPPRPAPPRGPQPPAAAAADSGLADQKQPNRGHSAIPAAADTRASQPSPRHTGQSCRQLSGAAAKRLRRSGDQSSPLHIHVDPGRRTPRALAADRLRMLSGTRRVSGTGGSWSGPRAFGCQSMKSAASSRRRLTTNCSTSGLL